MFARLGWITFALLLTTINARAGEAPVVKVMSFNIRYGTAKDGDDHWDKRKAFLVETIEAFEPDLLGTQETLGSQRDYLSQKLTKHSVFAAGRDDGKEKGEMAALYWRTDRFDKLDGGHFWLSTTPDKPGSKGWDAALPRMVTWVKLRDRQAKDAKPILFVNTHFDHLGRTARLESAKLMRAQIDKLGKDHAVIVTGDFNAGEGSEPYQAFFDNKSPLVDTFRIAHPKRGKVEGTANGFNPNNKTGARIDWIACSRDWSVLSARIDHTVKGGRTPSDHFAIMAVLKR
jgi:endonuclease/exonuclease/phosphatase family metal-dependent hydrolase